jgi:hypothetical protein
MNFFSLKFIIIRWYILIFGYFERHLENKLSTCGPNLNFKLVCVSDIEFFCLKRILTQNFNIVDLVNFFEKIKKIHIQILVVTLKMTSCKTMSENQDSMGKTYFFLSTLTLNPWAVSATWLHVGAPKKIQEKWAYNPFWTKIHHGLIRSWNLMYLVFPESLW